MKPFIINLLSIVAGILLASIIIAQVPGVVGQLLIVIAIIVVIILVDRTLP